MRLAKSSPNKATKAMNPADTGMLTGAVTMAIAAPRGAATRNNRKNVLSGVRQHLLVRIRRCFDVCFVLDCRRLNPRIGVLFSQSNLNGIIQLSVLLILRLRVFL